MALLQQSDVDELLNMLNQVPEDQQGMLKEAERVATVGAVGIFFYPDEGTHHLPHFHARVNADENGSFEIDSLSMMEGNLRPKYVKDVKSWAKTRKEQLSAAWTTSQSGGKPLKIASSLGANSGKLTFADFERVMRCTIVFELDEFLKKVNDQAVQRLVEMGAREETARTLVGVVRRRMSNSLMEVVRDPLDIPGQLQQLRETLDRLAGS